ncbi:uncharacterized protein LOC104883813 [Beta vulgaris subsp. vulgaris]|uniref:uncharacterized protein LOC104883813 n=1 Tax=Beta vulgaris subsp. vulgaris TaxID=3555 RepID=UPI00053F90F7|nr:uncharacterized protein LOC104883813 [Beta vulgaris subsp. vulgaris]
MINVHPDLAGKKRLVKLNELQKLRFNACDSSRLYKEQTKKWHDKRIKDRDHFKVGDNVLLFNSRVRLFPKKLKPTWSDPSSITKDTPYGSFELEGRVEEDFVRRWAFYDVESCLQINAFGNGGKDDLSDGLLRFFAEFD